MSPATLYKDLDHALAALGATGKVTTSGGYYTGTFNPDIPYLLDPIIDTAGQLIDTSTGTWRYLGDHPVYVPDATSVNRVGHGESTTLSLVADVVQHASNPLNIDPASIPAVLADLSKFNRGVSYYTVNWTVISGQLAIDYIVQLHTQLFPSFGTDATNAAAAAGAEAQRRAWAWWAANPDAPENASGVAPDQHECRLRGYRTAVTGLARIIGADGKATVARLSWTSHTGPPNPSGPALSTWGVAWIEPDPNTPIALIRINADGTGFDSATLDPDHVTLALVVLDRISGTTVNVAHS